MHVHPSFEERAVGFVLAVAGLIGLLVGLAAPNENATELVLGVALMAMGVRTYVHCRGEPVV
jgi:hypothetical protein